MSDLKKELRIREAKCGKEIARLRSIMDAGVPTDFALKLLSKDVRPIERAYITTIIKGEMK